MIGVVLFAIVVSLAHSAEVAFCTSKQKDVKSVDGSGGMGGYYKRPLPGNCRGQHGDMANWKPTFKITRATEQCKGGWKKYKGACYHDKPGAQSYRKSEEWCNQHQAHIFVPNNREEYLWVEQNVMKRNGWYYMGFFCAPKNTKNFNEVYANTREDVRIINKKLQIQLAHPIGEHSTPCMMAHRNNNSWRWQYHHQHGHEGRHAVCEAPMG